ncbi:hypothetical protein CCY99_01835 [Helicobacter sp. 16-1353]|uniref:NFACT family protein n=1 Tax=Helicobacter sp. 16-1353 TaxID=2004996 RepID=UPI000DCCE2E5|nr:NFACT family protein [Helicobacter sp. 16-1353]RAX54908.1 hypothetical protein CCY99_01835 [Helicobacter sp. 16-1353]
MNLFILQEIANLFKTFDKITYIGRLDDNLIKLNLDSQTFYINLEKSKSMIFCTNEAILSVKKYKAPFDFALQKYCLKANILDCNIDGNNRILRLFLHKKLDYKELNCILQLEFTGKYTNAIILDSNFIILESLRKISQNTRIVKPGIALSPLNQQVNFKIREVDFGGDILQFLYTSYANLIKLNLDSLKQQTITLLESKKQKLIALLENLPNKDSLIAKSKYYAEIGHLIQNNMNAKLSGNSITLKNYNGEFVTYNLDNDIGFKSNAILVNEFFMKSKKLQLKSKNISIQEENLKDNIAFLDAKINFVMKANNINDIKIINPKTKQNLRYSPSKDKVKLPYESFFIDSVKISIGKNKNENIALLKDAKSNDMWMHIRGIPSSHLIIHCSKMNIRDDVLQKAGEILVGFLKAKSGNFIVDYTRRKFVKIKEGANVVYSNHSTINIKK